MKANKQVEEIKIKLLPILKEYKVKKAGIFGSYARGEQTKNSDVDILVEVEKNMGLIEFIKLKTLIEKEIKRRIDLVEYETIKSEIKENILKDEISIIK